MTGGEDVAEALWYVGPGRAEIREERLKPLADGHVRVRALYSAISRGTEALIAAGRVPASEYQRMRAPFMGGTFPFPVKYGYATVGRVEAGPDGADRAQRVRPASASDQIRSAGRGRRAGAIRCSRRRARCWPPTWRPR